MPDLLALLDPLGATPAYAQAPGGSAAFMTSFAPFLLIFVLFYFLLIRPQQKRQKLHRQLIEGIKKGDKLVTNGGILGTVTAAAKDVVTLQVADNVRLRVLRSEIMGTQEELAGGNGGAAPAKSGGRDKAEAAKETKG